MMGQKDRCILECRWVKEFRSSFSFVNCRSAEFCIYSDILTHSIAMVGRSKKFSAVVFLSVFYSFIRESKMFGSRVNFRSGE